MIALLSALALTLTPATALQPQDPGANEVPPIQDLGDTYLLTFSETEEGLSLERFVKLCQQSTGINFTYNNDTAISLRAQKVRMYGPKVIPKNEFYSFFQIIMIINRYVCKRIGPEHLSVVVVESLDTGQGRGGARADSIYVSPGELPLYADQPATLIQTVVVLPNIEVRTLANSMRQLAPDPNTLTAVPVGDNTVILQGFGSNIAALVRMLELVDEASKAEDPVLPEFEVIKLAFASADEIAETLEELLEASLDSDKHAKLTVESFLQLLEKHLVLHHLHGEKLRLFSTPRRSQSRLLSLERSTATAPPQTLLNKPEAALSG